ncbi:MAG TPA: DUF2807 domain-containing protein [Bacteroidia bacterium]|nr:DUF2807 domain-containing protein [Bacteroidia bacterium]
MKRLLYILLIPFILASCNEDAGPEDCFKPAGKYTEKEINTGSFTEIIVGDRFVVEFRQDTVDKIIVKGGENVIANVNVKVTDGKLTVKDNNVCNWTRDFSRKIKLTVHCSKLKKLTINDACEITGSDTLRTPSMEINQNSTGTVNLTVIILSNILGESGQMTVNHKSHGEVKLSGYAPIFVPVLFDAGKLDAANFTGDYIFVYHYGINDAHVKPYKVLYVYVGNTGNTYYYAQPFEQPLNVTQKGQGQVIFR